MAKEDTKAVQSPVWEQLGIWACIGEMNSASDMKAWAQCLWQCLTLVALLLHNAKSKLVATNQIQGLSA
jgi:hypothetical protein